MAWLRTRMREPNQDQALTLESMEPVVALATHLPNPQRTHTHTLSNATQQTSALARPARARHAGSPRSASHGYTISSKPDRSNQAEFACMHARNGSTLLTQARRRQLASSEAKPVTPAPADPLSAWWPSLVFPLVPARRLSKNPIPRWRRSPTDPAAQWRAHRRVHRRSGPRPP
jgi:hypothetical protein